MKKFNFLLLIFISGCVSIPPETYSIDSDKSVDYVSDNISGMASKCWDRSDNPLRDGRAHSIKRKINLTTQIKFYIYAGDIGRQEPSIVVDVTPTKKPGYASTAVVNIVSGSNEIHFIGKQIKLWTQGDTHCAISD